MFTPLVYALAFVKENIPDYKSLIVSRSRLKPLIISPTKPLIISSLKPLTFIESLAKPTISSELYTKSPISSKSPITKLF